jgi:hypothetical protein
MISKIRHDFLDVEPGGSDITVTPAQTFSGTFAECQAFIDGLRILDGVVTVNVTGEVSTDPAATFAGFTIENKTGGVLAINIPGNSTWAGTIDTVTILDCQSRITFNAPWGNRAYVNTLNIANCAHVAPSMLICQTITIGQGSSVILAPCTAYTLNVGENAICELNESSSAAIYTGRGFIRRAPNNTGLVAPIAPHPSVAWTSTFGRDGVVYDNTAAKYADSFIRAAIAQPTPIMLAPPTGKSFATAMRFMFLGNTVSGTSGPLNLTHTIYQFADAVNTFRWNAVAGATQYNIQTSIDGGLTWVNRTPNPVTNSIQILPISGTYLVRVRAVAGGVAGDWCNPLLAHSSSPFDHSDAFVDTGTQPYPVTALVPTVTGTTVFRTDANKWIEFHTTPGNFWINDYRKGRTDLCVGGVWSITSYQHIGYTSNNYYAAGSSGTVDPIFEQFLIGWNWTGVSQSALAPVATSGSYDDLINKPTIPPEYTHPVSHPASMITGLADIATTGDYNDLINTPAAGIQIYEELSGNPVTALAYSLSHPGTFVFISDSP